MITKAEAIKSLAPESQFVIVGDELTWVVEPSEPVTEQMIQDEIARLERLELVSGIDDMVADIYRRWTRFEAEYELRESEAHAYKDAGYIGDVPRQVAAFSQRANLTAQQATDLILSQAAALRASLANLGDIRMRKYEVINAPDAETAQLLFNEIKSLIITEAASVA